MASTKQEGRMTCLKRAAVNETLPANLYDAVQNSSRLAAVLGYAHILPIAEAQNNYVGAGAKVYIALPYTMLVRRLDDAGVMDFYIMGREHLRRCLLVCSFFLWGHD